MRIMLSNLQDQKLKKRIIKEYLIELSKTNQASEDEIKLAETKESLVGNSFDMDRYGYILIEITQTEIEHHNQSEETNYDVKDYLGFAKKLDEKNFYHSSYSKIYESENKVYFLFQW